MSPIGLEVQFTSNMRIIPGWCLHCSPGAPKTVASEVSLTETIALENVSLYNCFDNVFVFESVLLFLVFVTQILLKLVIL